jgi:glucan phosphoethanolaminetransferase (alkaline phosphatase superfamily)
MLVYPEMWFVYLFIVPRFGVGVREAWRKNRSALLAILLIVAPIIMSYALKTAVSGEAIRMRSQFMPILLIFAGVGHAVIARRRAERKQRAATRNAVIAHVEPRAQAGT